MADPDDLMTLAGLWEEWREPKSGEIVRSCTIISREPNAKMAALHNRMPVILAEEQWSKWLGEEPADEEEVYAMLKPCPDDWIDVWPVGEEVGNVRNNWPNLVKPVQDELFDV